MVEASVSRDDLGSLSKPAISLRVPPTDAVKVREIHVGAVEASLYLLWFSIFSRIACICTSMLKDVGS